MTFPRTNSPAIGIVSAVVVVLLIIVVSLAANLARVQKNYRHEQRQKMSVEEGIASLKQTVAAVTGERDTVQKELTSQKYMVEILTKEISQIKEEHEALKEENAKITKLKEQLESDLKEALYSRQKAH